MDTKHESMQPNMTEPEEEERARAERERLRRQREQEAIHRGKRLTLCVVLALSFALIYLTALLLRMQREDAASGRWQDVQPTNLLVLTQTTRAPQQGDAAQAGDEQAGDEQATSAPEEQPQPTATPAPTQQPTFSAGEQVPTFETEDELARTTVLISAAGDCTLGGDVGSSRGQRFSQYVERYGMDYFLENVRGIFSADDFTVVNLEGPLTTQTQERSGRQFNFRGDPEYVQILSGSSVEVCSLANNHALDFQQAGLSDTANNLQAAGIGAAGYDNAYYAEKNGVRICFLSFTEWDYTQSELARRVEQEKQESDLVIVSMHWGEELRHSATASQKAYGRALIDAGADLVLGHHPHVVGGIEKYKGKYIVYSLGNFCFGGNSDPDDKNTMIFQQQFVIDADKNVIDDGINIIPCLITSDESTNNYQPTPLAYEGAMRVIEEIQSYSYISGDPIKWLDGYIGNA